MGPIWFSILVFVLGLLLGFFSAFYFFIDDDDDDNLA